MENPLVSIIVITYNSSKYVLETLKSAYNQTYENIELIVSDDCSTDNTVEICMQWIDNNKGRFIRAKLITVEKNTGITPNFNRGLYVAKGEWVKFIAGDDILTNNCIEELIHFVKENPKLNIKFLVHGLSPFSIESEFLPIFPPDKMINKTVRNQLLYLLKRGNCISGAAFFLELKTLLFFNGFDENYKLLEDFPLLIKYTQNNYRIWLIKKPFVRYRIHGSNISFSNSTKYQGCFLKFRNEILTPLTLKYKLYLVLWHQFISEKQKNKNKVIRMLLAGFSPLGWVYKIYNIFGKSYSYNYKLEFQRK